MESGSEIEQPQPTRSVTLYQALVGVAAVSGILIVLVFQLTSPIIKRNKARALKKAVFEVIPNAAAVVTYKLAPSGELVVLEGEDEKAVKYYAGYDESGTFRGVAIEAAGQGYQDTIRLLFGYSPQREQIVGLKVLESKETPGLGDKIEKDQNFTVQFLDLDVRLGEDKEALRNDIEVVKKGQRTEKWQIAAITGATVSSKAVGKILNRGSNTHLPRIAHNISRLEGGDDANER